MKEKFEICLVNRNYPPEGGSTGYYAHQLISYLDNYEDIITKVVSIGKVQTNKQKTILGYYKGKNKLIRLIASFLESYRLIKKAKEQKSDIYIILTDPAFLNYWAAKLLQREKWVLWSMDLFPEAFAANNLVDVNNRLYRHFENVLRKNSPNLVISLGPNQGRIIKKNRYSNSPTLPSVVGIRNEENLGRTIKLKSPSWHDATKITFAYIGNLGEAHDTGLVIYLAKILDPDKHQMIVCCRGKYAKVLSKEVGDLDSVIVINDILDSHFALIDVQIVSLRSAWTHISVPSKALTAMQFGNAVAFLGNRESDSWQFIQKASWNMSTHNDILSFIASITQEVVEEKKKKSREVGSYLLDFRTRCFERILQSLRQINSE